MKEIPNLNWIKTTFSREEEPNQIWKNWAIGFSGRSGQDLLKVIYGHYKEEFQKRALFLLLVPNTRSAPFFWLHSDSCHYLEIEIDFSKVGPGLRAHAVYWLTKFMDYTKYWPLPTDENRQTVALSSYYKYALNLLTILPAEDNQREALLPHVFSCHQILQALQKMEGKQKLDQEFWDTMKRPADITPNEKEQSET